MPQDDNDTVLHQDAHEAIIDERLDGVDTENTGIADLVAITGGQSPTEAEHNLVITTVNAILASLVNSRIIPEAS
jgi:hypothetical protein